MPAVKNAAWVKNPIDAFILAELEAKGLPPRRRPTKPPSLRRVYYTRDRPAADAGAGRARSWPIIRRRRSV
jgi:hypothetical protein